MQNFSGQEPVHEADGLWGSVVAWNGNVDVFQWRIAIGQGNDWDVNVAGLSDGLVIGFLVGDDNEFWFFVAGLGVIGEGTWRESAVDGRSAEECSKFQDSSLTVVFAGNEANVFWVFDGGDDSGGQLKFLPHLVEVEYVGTGRLVSFEDIKR